MDEYIIELTPFEKEIDALLRKSGFFLQTYRAIDALSVLEHAQRMIEEKEVKWQVKAALYRNMAQAKYQLGHFEEAMSHFIQSYEILEDGNDKAAAAGMIAGYYLRNGNLDDAAVWTDKAEETATEPELMAGPYQIRGGIADAKDDYPKAIELLNKAAALAEESHCLTDVAMYISDIAAVYVRMGMLETALSEMYRAERYAKECRNLDLFFRFAIRRAKILYKMGKDEEAKKLIMALDEQKN